MKNSQENLKLFYKILKTYSKEKVNGVQYIKNKQEEIKTDSAEIINRWEEHFDKSPIIEHQIIIIWCEHVLNKGQGNWWVPEHANTNRKQIGNSLKYLGKEI